MQFTKTENIYKVIRITGSQNNILGVCFSKNNSNDIKVVEWIKEDDSNKQTSKNQVLEQVTLGLKEINQSLGTNYRLSKIYYLPSESSSDFVYKFLIMKLIRHYHHGNEFKVT